MKKKIFLIFLPLTNLTVINVVACQNETNYSTENIELLNELENELKTYNWKTPLFNQENNKLKDMINNLEAIKLKINIAEKLQYNEKMKFQDEFNSLEKKVEITKVKIPTLKKINLENINIIFDWINNKIMNYINTIKTKFITSSNKSFFLEKINKAEIINKFFIIFPKAVILLPTDQTKWQNENETCNIANCDIANFISMLLHHFRNMEQINVSDKIEEIATKKIEILHTIWTRLWQSNANTIYEQFKNPNDNFIK